MRPLLRCLATIRAIMGVERVGSLRVALRKLWLISPERLWLASISLQQRGWWPLALALKQLNAVAYHNSLAPGASVARDIELGHYGHGVVVNRNVEIGSGVKIWHNVTLTAGRRERVQGRAGSGARSRIVVENGVRLGANAVVIAPRGKTLTIGRGARIGAGAVVTDDVPPGATVVPAPVRVIVAQGPSAGA
jgi:serine O-acetyltransferase